MILEGLRLHHLGYCTPDFRNGNFNYLTMFLRTLECYIISSGYVIGKSLNLMVTLV